MTSESGRLTTRIAGASVRRRSLLRVGAVAGVLLAAALPAAALADKDGDKDNGRHLAKGHHKRGLLDVTGSAAGGAAFRGQLRVLNFEAVQGTPNQLLAHGTLSGQFRDAAGKVVATVEDAAFSAPVTHLDDPACTILHLVLGPLTLNLLGLVLTIPNTIIIDLTAIPGGGLLGDLLCAVDNLLQGGLAGLLGNLTTLLQLVTALNNFFDALNGL
jgi:hypothetical protein